MCASGYTDYVVRVVASSRCSAGASPEPVAPRGLSLSDYLGTWCAVPEGRGDSTSC